MSALDSKFSLNWYDKSDYINSEEFSELKPDYIDKVIHFITHGYAIFEKAIPEPDIDNYIKNIYSKCLAKNARRIQVRSATRFSD